MSGHRSRGAALEYNVTVEEIKDNMKTILGKVNFKREGGGGAANASKCKKKVAASRFSELVVSNLMLDCAGNPQEWDVCGP